MVFNHRIAACQLLARGRIYLTPDMVIKLAEQSIYLIILISAPLLLIALGVGLLVSVFQAMTQIQEQTLAFIPKILAVFLSLVIFGPWMLTMLLDYTRDLFEQLPRFIG
jgi:flagellar biosynthetic protein FliQ